VIYQEFSLVPAMTVSENLLLGREHSAIRYSPVATRERAAAITQAAGIEIGAALDCPVRLLSPAVRQRIEIVKALSDDVKLLVMDEPTARLSESERSDLFNVTRQLAARGVSIIFISHYLEEVRAITDRVTVVRNGAIVATASSEETTVERMAALMLGEDFKRTLDAEGAADHAHDVNAVVLEAKGVSVGNRLRNVSVQLRAGEIVGIAGLVGSGRTRLCRVLAGVDQPTVGTLALYGEDIKLSNPRKAISRGIVLIPEDREDQALNMRSPISENLVLMALRRGLSRFGYVSRNVVRKAAQELVETLQIHPADIGALAGTLSGGNQQKVVLGKALAAQPAVMVIDQPTAGIDIGTKAQIHRLLQERAREGVAILVVSDDLEELYALSDRINVLRQGRVLWNGKASQVSFDQLVEMISSESTLPAGT
jgi:ABC-type sugar transport system ATPase subunit